MADLWTILADGGETRKVTDINGNGCPGVALGQDISDDVDVEIGDTVGITYDEVEQSITIQCGPGKDE